MTTYVFKNFRFSHYTIFVVGGVNVLDPEIIGKVIQRIREQKKQSQELVSGFAGIGRTHLSAIERGERKPTLETFFKIADALDIKPSVLMAAIEDELNKQDNRKK